MNARAFDALARRAATGLNRRTLFGVVTGATLVALQSPRRARAHEVNYKNANAKCEKEIKEAQNAADEDGCAPYFYLGQFELWEECENALVDCLQRVANSNCYQAAYWEPGDVKRPKECLADWRHVYEVDGNPFKALVKFLVRNAKKEKKK
jgi:hypothetical protein